MQPAGLDQALTTLGRLVSQIKPPSSSRLKSAIVALYSSEPKIVIQDLITYKLRYSGKIGLLDIDYDRQLKNYFLRLYDIERLVLLLQVQLYYGFMDFYRLHDSIPNLYYFEYLDQAHFAFLFKSSEEAEFFRSKLEQVAPKMSTLDQLNKKEKLEYQKTKKQNSFFGKMVGFFKGKDQKNQTSKVLTVRKSSAITFDNNGSLITENISPDWEEIIINSGLKKVDLKIPEIARTVLQQILLYKLQKDSLQNQKLIPPTRLSSLQQEKHEQINRYNEQKKKQSEQSENNGLNQSQIPLQKQFEKQNEKEVNNLKLTSESETVTNSQVTKLLYTKDFIQSQNIQDTLFINNGANQPIPPQPLNLLPPPPLTLPPPSLPTTDSMLFFSSDEKGSVRSNLLEEIRTNKIVLRHVKTNEGKVQINASELNKEQRKDLGQQIRQKLKRRALAMRKKRNSSDQQQD